MVACDGCSSEAVTAIARVRMCMYHYDRYTREAKAVRSGFMSLRPVWAALCMASLNRELMGIELLS